MSQLLSLHGVLNTTENLDLITAVRASNLFDCCDSSGDPSPQATFRHVTGDNSLLLRAPGEFLVT